MRALSSAIALSLLAILALGCDAMGYAPPPAAATIPPVILSIDGPSPALRGSLLRVRGLHMEGAIGLRVTTSTGREVALELAEDEAIVETAPRQGEAFFTITSELASIGAGPQVLTGVLETALANSDPYTFNLQLATSVSLTLREAPSGTVHFNDNVVLHGGGFLAPGEGTVNARFTGEFVVDGTGERRPIDVAVPVVPAERFARDRGVVALSTSIGAGIDPGSFSGTMTLEAQPMGGMAMRSSTLPVALYFGLPEIYGPYPEVATLEQIVEIRGAGFVNNSASPEETTLIRIDGTFTPIEGSQTRITEDLVFQYVSGGVLRADAMTRAEVRSQKLVSSMFGASRGTFSGEATPIIRRGGQEISGGAVPFTFTISSARQIVQLRFLPGFYDSLARFGLSAAAGEIEQRVQRRMGGIYSAYALDVRLEKPVDYMPNGYAVVEIGGPDPTGSALFGYDNTPGKDVGNLRLYDEIGGSNAETQSDGQAGYGGVFVDSFLLWSTHPGLRRPREGGPMPDPDFDALFDPVRARPATLDEVRGMGDMTRVAEVQAALDALASIVGETTAHELGHSLGLAEPRGSRTTFHNSGDSPGCIMDNGGARPFGERAQLEGFTPTRFCRDEPSYLAEILPR